VHNSYFFLRQVGIALDARLKGCTLVSSFSQSKDELLIEFNDGTNSFFLKATLSGDLQCLSFPAQLHRARKNTVDLFNELLMKKVAGARAIANDRSLLLELDGGYGLLFKMHGTQSNVILIAHNKPVSIFRKNLVQDSEITPSSLERELDWTEKGFREASDLARHYFTFGKEVWAYLDEKNFRQETADGQWRMLEDLRKQLDAPALYYHVEYRGGLVLSLLPFGKILAEFRDPLEAVTAFVPAFASRISMDRERRSATAGLTQAIRRTRQYLAKTEHHLDEISKDKHFQAWGDILMANLDRIPEGAGTIELENFYDNSLVTIKLNPQLSPQKNAEHYYIKGKNRALEINRLEQLLNERRAQLAKLEAELAAAANAGSLKELRTLSSVTRDEQASKAVKLPYREVLFMGFRIWIGKDAPANDELTFKLGFKEDLWLHATDVSGSHVLIKHQSGKKFPKDVIERAAQLAAWFSKRKTDTLCPVAVTPKKFLRKRKGDPAGMVVVEKENVVMVEPKGIESVDKSVDSGI
jgi:predicted ribosome quality control (RQC) complex YloA/Tae2 family protein